MEFPSSINLVDSVIDEIALEGLDGITLEALWDRIAIRFHETTPLSHCLMEQIWNICLQVQELSFYELKEERAKLIIYDRYEFVDPDLGIILESDNMPDDIYDHCPVDDWKNGIKGSCATYYTRKDISNTARELSLEEAEKIYKRKLVIVGSQAVRQNALMDKSVCPILDLTVMQYCFLERVGRSRYHGEVTQGKLSLSLLKEDPRSLFYHRKFLLRHKLITKQTHHQKSGGHSGCGSLFHLTRFYIERKPRIIFLAERVIEILKSRENHIAEYGEIKKELKIENSIKKLFKTAFFQKIIKTDLLVPWRTLYPQATDKEWQHKSNPAKEKMIRVVQLIDPNVYISDLWKDEVIMDDDDPYELDTSQQKYSVPFLKQANDIVEANKEEGLDQTKLAQKMGLPKLQSRTIFRNLAKMNIVARYMNDMARQRVTKYVSRKFESGSRMRKQFQREINKMKELTRVSDEKPTNEIKNETSPEELSKPSVAENENTETSKKIEKTIPETEPEKIESPKPLLATSNVRTHLFEAASKILHKYKLTGCKRTYKKTFCNVAEMEDPVVKRCKLTKNNNDTQSQKKSNNSEISTINELKEKLLIHEQVESIEETGNDVIGLKDFTNPDSKKVPNVTYKLLRRANIIMETIKEQKVVDDMTKLIKAITEEEEREGYSVKIDKKSLVRLLQRLAKDNLVKNIKLTLSTNDKKKSLTFICDPSIDVNHTVIRSAVEQAKVKFCLIGAQKVKTILQSNTEELELSNENADKVETIETLSGNDKAARKVAKANLIYDRKAGRRSGYAPKFIRMQALHAYLFYTIYEHPGKPVESQEKLIETLRGKGATIDEKLEKEMSPIFNTEIGWKMFVHPLPKHNGWPHGWALMCDLLIRMPLSIFLKIHHLSYAIPGLEDYTKDPIRKHLLVKNLPTPIRSILLVHRKYVFSIHETITRLCYIGLLQFGPSKFKEKDKVFIYLNRKAELLDTTSSEAHYHKIEPKIYPVIRYMFTSLKTVDSYWYKLWTICTNTRLGGRLVVQGKDIVLEDLNKKHEMMEATKPRKPEEAPLADNSSVPGDRRGAAGIDSAFFAHLKRNWNWESSNYPFQRLNAPFDREGTNFEVGRDDYMSRMKQKSVKITESQGSKKQNAPVVIDAIDLRKTQTKNPAAAPAWKPKHNRVTTLKSGTSGRQRSYVRRVLPTRSRVRSRVKYDEIDYSALQKMDKLRVDWNTREDNILLVCKVAMMYLCPNSRRQMINFASVRDVLRSYSLTSYNKTSKACQRRLMYMLKKPETYHSVSLGVEELRQDFNVNRRYGDIVEKLRNECRGTAKYSEQVNLVFRDLVTHIAKKHYDISEVQSSSLNFTPKTIEEFHLFHRVKHPRRITSLQGFHDDTTNDIHSSTINSVIHSSMCCVKDRRSWAYQLFRIYQQYPEWLLRNSMAKIRADQMITIKKNYVFAIRKQPNTCMPMSSSQYQLSSGYVQKFNTKIPYSIFKEAWNFFFQLGKNYYDNYVEKMEEDQTDKEKNTCMITTPVNGGIVAAIHDFINIDGLEFDLEIPKHIIMLDPSLQKEDERYVRLARRYQDLLRNWENVDGEDNSVDNVVSKDLKSIDDSPRDLKEGHDKSSAKQTSYSKLKESINIQNDLEIRKNRQVGKQQDYQETNVNTDNENCENDQEINFDEEDCNDEIDDNDYEDDDLICFIDGTKIRITREDIENSGFRVNNETSRIFEAASYRENDKPTENSLSKNDAVEKSREVDEKSFLEKNPLEMEMECSPKVKENVEQEGKSDKEEKNISGVVECPSEILQLEDDLESGDVRVNDLIDRAHFTKFNGPSYYRNGDTNDVQKRYTRLAMLRMREELNDLASTDSQHAHEYFVLNMFKIFYSFNDKCIERPLDLREIQGLRLPDELLPLKRENHATVVADLKKYAIFPKSNPVSYERFKQSLQLTQRSAFALDTIYKFIYDKKEIGASLTQLSTQFYSSLGKELYDVLALLKEGRMVLRSGVTNTRYIHQEYAEPWLIQSYKIMRLQKEAHQTILAGSLYVVSDEKSKKKDEGKCTNEMKEAASNENIDNKQLNINPESSPRTSEMVEEIEKNKKNNEASPEDSETGKSSSGKMQRSRTCLLPTKDIYRAAKQLDLDTAEEIRVVVRPWIRIDGALNRRVLDRMLGGILAYCLIHPGIHLTKIQEKFSPAIQPFHTKELVEILMRLECLKMGSMRKTPVTLFSKSASRKTVFTCVPERFEWSEENLAVEPMLGATLKFSMFLSNRTYTTDFLT